MRSLCVALCLLACGCGPGGELGRFQGKWVSPKATMHVRNDSAVIEKVGVGERPVKYRLRLNPEANPKELDLIVADPGHPLDGETVALAIYAFTGSDSLDVAWIDPPLKDRGFIEHALARPREFTGADVRHAFRRQ